MTWHPREGKGQNERKSEGYSSQISMAVTMEVGTVEKYSSWFGKTFEGCCHAKKRSAKKVSMVQKVLWGGF